MAQAAALVLEVALLVWTWNVYDDVLGWPEGRDECGARGAECESMYGEVVKPEADLGRPERDRRGAQ